MSLAQVLDGQITEIEERPVEQPALREGMCVECEDMPAQMKCTQCCDDFCKVCFQSLHRKGTRQSHSAVEFEPSIAGDITMANTTSHQDEADYDEYSQPSNHQSIELLEVAERAHWIPLRLNQKERKALRLLEAALKVSEYTDKIDVLGRGDKQSKIVAQIKDLCAILCGLVVASDYQIGQQLVQDKDYQHNAEFFQKIFELGRRYKILNPAHMRDTYGKLMFLLMDCTSSPQIREMLEFEVIVPVVTVASVLEQAGSSGLLKDPLVQVATMEISTDTYQFTRSELEEKQIRKKTRREIQSEIKAKERAIEQLARKYSNRSISEESVRQCLYSISDSNNYLANNRDPVDKVIRLLKQYFDLKVATPSLAIQVGQSGARLSHTHSRQYAYVLQSLLFWREVAHNMFKLWCCAEQDMLAKDNTYRLRDTGQGLNRIQSSPKVSRVIHGILNQVMSMVGPDNWCGSSVVHLGDTNVPNSLIFIDKYVRVERILSPLVKVIEAIDSDLVKNPHILEYINKAHDSPQQLKVEILQDFFRYGFDGSGGSNFFEAGSCIDGRLTSAFQWTTQVEKKPYFPIFLMAGFVAFEGEF